MALRPRKSIIGDLRKLFSNDKESKGPPGTPPPIPPLPPQDLTKIPVNALRISHFGIVQERHTTFYSKSDPKFFIGDNWYHVPHCIQAPGTPVLDPLIRRFTWHYKGEFTSHATPAAKKDSFKGAYSVWYKESRKSTLRPKTLAQVDGDFWVLKQVQPEPKVGETVEWTDVEEDMLRELDHNWWFLGVQLPDINDACDKEAAANPRGLAG